MKEISIIFPHQLYKTHPALNPTRKVILVEEWLYFKQYYFHKQKLVLHRASMKWYEHYLQQKNFYTEYIEVTDNNCDIRLLLSALAQEGLKTLHYVDTTDNWLEKRIYTSCAHFKINVVKYASPNFLNPLEEVNQFFDTRKTYFQTDFYIEQRKKRNLLIENNNKPIGGRWTFDAENRLKFPKIGVIPTVNIIKENQWVQEAKMYVEKNFPKNYGTVTTCLFPVTFNDSEKWLDDFFQQRFYNFGIYEDAMVSKENFLFHSAITPMLNIGLLQPQQIIDQAIDAAIQYDIPLNSLEGFIRQIVGWREFIRSVYSREGSRQRTKNFWSFRRKIPKSFWQGSTGIDPVDEVIKKVLATGYSHHIERLMVLGNFMLLCEFDPDEVYRWFMEMYADSYDWVMVPNVYGMTQFADGGLMTTKPYISGSNYLLKMGNWQKGEWQQIWDGLFWRFMHTHRDFFLKNPRLGMLVKTFDKMPVEKKTNHLKIADKYLSSLDDEKTKKN